MRLVQAEIEQFRCFVRPQTLRVDPMLTWVVGRSDSGKTSLLQALARCLPLDTSTWSSPTAGSSMPDQTIISAFDPARDIPRATLPDDSSAADTSPIKAVVLTFSLTPAEMRAIEAACRPVTLESDLFDITFFFNAPPTSTLPPAALAYIAPLLPRFFMVGTPDTLPARGNLNKPSALIQHFLSTLGLNATTLNTVSATPEAEQVNQILKEAAERLNHLMTRYWFPHHRLELFFSAKKHLLTFFVTNAKHQDRRPLDEESSGYQYLVSFLLQLWPLVATNPANSPLTNPSTEQATEPTSTPHILLLDEPAQGLGVPEQRGMVRFLQHALHCQVIFTTRSPFMIDSLTFHQGRTIYNSYNAAQGCYLSDKLRRVGWRAVFPLQTALGYSLAQNLYISTRNLLVEGVSDQVYLGQLSHLLKERGRTGLAENIAIVPVAGVDKITAFTSLLKGNDLSLVCVLDTPPHRRAWDQLQHLVDKHLLRADHILFYQDFIPADFADIEDMFDQVEYLNFFNLAFNTSVSLSDLDPELPIMHQLRHLNDDRDFNHYTPAKAMERNLESLTISPETLNRFERLFQAVNRLCSR